MRNMQQLPMGSYGIDVYAKNDTSVYSRWNNTAIRLDCSRMQPHKITQIDTADALKPIVGINLHKEQYPVTVKEYILKEPHWWDEESRIILGKDKRKAALMLAWTKRVPYTVFSTIYGASGAFILYAILSNPIVCPD